VDDTSTTSAAVAQAAGIQDTVNIPDDKLPYLGLMGILILGIAALYVYGPGSKPEQPFGLK
jgi:hypothetical protein